MIFKRTDLLELEKELRQENNALYISFKEASVLEYIKIYFDEQCIWDKAKVLTLAYVDESGEFKDFDSLKLYSEELVCFKLESKIKTKQIKLYSEDFLVFKDIKIFSRKYPGLMVAARGDGLGARLLPLLNAYVLSVHTGLKFAYTWHYWKNYPWFRDITLVDDNKLSSIGTGKESEIFSEEFIKEYSYTELLEADRGYIKRIDLNGLKSLPFDKPWGWYVSFTLIYQGIFKETKEIGKLYKEAWEWIGFSKNIKRIIQEGSQKAIELFGKNFIAIHIRSGDGVFNPITRNSQSGFWLKMCPGEIGMELIEQNEKETIVLFGDDFNQIKELQKKYSKTHNIFIIEEFLGKLEKFERNFFEISFMSQAKKIYSGDSSFAKVAAYVGLGDDPTFYYSYFNFESMFKIVKKHFHRADNLNVHTLQKAYTCYFLYGCAKQCGLKKEALKYIILAHSFNTSNSLYIISALLSFYENNKHSEAQKFLQTIHLDDILPVYFSSLYFQQSCALLYEFVLHFPKDQQFLKIKEFLKSKGVKPRKLQSPHSAKARIHNHLAYKLGSAMIRDSKSPLGYLKMPFILSSLAISHKEEQKNVKFIHSMPLEFYSDYKEALKEKQCFTYKLGLALIKASKTWFLGGYLLFFFRDLPKLISEFKAKKAKIDKI